MSIDHSKLCADLLRQNHASKSAEKLKASHARELIAAFFGYKSHASLMADNAYPIAKIDEAYIFIPDLGLMEERRSKLKGLPSDLASSMEIATLVSNKLTSEALCGGDIWLYSTFEGYIAEVLLPDNVSEIDDQLSGVMVETNAGFYDAPYFDDVVLDDRKDELIVIAKAQYKGESMDDKPFCGDTLDITVKLTFPRATGKRCFLDYELEVGGSINDDWVDREQPQRMLAEELGISDDDLDELEWEFDEITSNDGHPYGYVITFSEDSPKEILDKIEGLDEYRSIRVSVNAFDEPYPDESEDFFY